MQGGEGTQGGDGMQDGEGTQGGEGMQGGEGVRNRGTILALAPQHPPSLEPFRLGVPAGGPRIDGPDASVSEVCSWPEFRVGKRKLHLGQGEPVCLEVPRLHRGQE